MEEETLCQSFYNCFCIDLFPNDSKLDWAVLWPIRKKLLWFFQVSSTSSEAQPETKGKPLAKAVDEIITPPQGPAQPFWISQDSLLSGSKQEKLKLTPPHKNVWEFLHYIIILDMFLWCSVITEKSRLVSQKEGLCFQECPKLASFEKSAPIFK